MQPSKDTIESRLVSQWIYFYFIIDAKMEMNQDWAYDSRVTSNCVRTEFTCVELRALKAGWDFLFANSIIIYREWQKPGVIIETHINFHTFC